MFSTLLLGSVLFVSGCQSGADAMNNERAITASAVPPAAMASIQREAAGARIDSYKQLTEDGKTLYLGTYKQSGRDVGIEVYPDGKICCIEFETTLDQVPPAAAATLNREYPGAKLSEIEKIDSRTNKRISYKFEGTSGGKKFEIEIAADGSIVARD